MNEVPLREDILTRIQGIVALVVRNPSLVLTEETTAQDVPGWDSLNHVQIIMAVEREFRIRLRAVEVAQLQDAGSLVNLVLARRQA